MAQRNRRKPQITMAGMPLKANVATWFTDRLGNRTTDRVCVLTMTPTLAKLALHRLEGMVALGIRSAARSEHVSINGEVRFRLERAVKSKRSTRIVLWTGTADGAVGSIHDARALRLTLLAALVLSKHVSSRNREALALRIGALDSLLGVDAVDLLARLG